MFVTDKLSIKVDGFRAVHSANITIGDMTILSGVNACGKSTIAHLVHVLVNLNRNYEKLALDYVWRPMRRAWWSVRRLRDQLLGDEERTENPAARSGSIGERIEAFRSDVKIMIDAYHKMAASNADDADRYLNSFLSNVMYPNAESANVDELILWFDRQLDEVRNNFGELKRNRSRNVWTMADRAAVRWLKYPGSVKLFEGEKCVYSSDDEKNGIGEILNIDHAFYIESPWRNLPGPVSDDELYSINDGFDFRSVDEAFEPDDEMFDAIGGKFTDDPEAKQQMAAFHRPMRSNALRFERNDGRGSYPLEECATGIKSMSILNFLYTRGCLNNRTLLVIDEPEAHLHPQWILEYAKIMVRLNRKLGVRFLITTHSPDMLNAIRRVGNVEEVPDLRFYVAEDSALFDSIDYDYKPLGREVEEIFAKFNLAADKTEMYGVERGREG